MKQGTLVLSSLIIFLIFSGCAKKPSKTAQGYWDSAVSLFNSKEYESSINEYRELVKFYPDDTLSIAAMFAMADIYKNNLNNLDSALSIYYQIVNRYPNSDKTPNAMFMIGYIYANDIKDYDKARESYQEFLQKYPDNVLALSAKWEIENLGKSLNEIPYFQSVTKDTQ